MYVEQHRQKHRAVWKDADGRKQREPFETRRQAELFVLIAQLNTPELARRYVRGELDRNALIMPTAANPQGADTGALALPPATGSARPGDSVLFKSYARAHLDQKTGVSQRTVSDAVRLLENHLLPYWCADDLTLAQIRQTDRADRPGHRLGADGRPLSISNWILWLQQRSGRDNQGRETGKPLSPKTIHNTHALLSEILKAACDDDDRLLDRNPCAISTLPELQNEERIYLEQHQVRALHDAIDPFFRPLVLFLVLTGVRWGEAAGLMVKHVHLDPEQGQPYVDVVVAWRRLLGGVMQLGRVKSRSSQRSISLPPELVAVLRPLLLGRQPDAPVFTMRGNGRLHHANFVNRFFAPAVAATGLPERTRPHSLRHTHVAWLIAARVPMLAISRRLGHSSEQFTSKRYGHLLERVRTELVDALSLAAAGVVAIPVPRNESTTAPAPADVSPLTGLESSLTADEEPARFVLDDSDAALPEVDIDEADDVAA